MTSAKKQRGIGFGFDPVESPGHFAVLVPRNDRDQVVIEERYTWGDSPAADTPKKPVPKAYLDAYRWSRIANVTRAQFNKRLRDAGKDTADWMTGSETLLAPYFGPRQTRRGRSDASLMKFRMLNSSSRQRSRSDHSPR